MTIRELFREFAALKDANDDQHDRDVILAYRIEALHRTKTLPALSTLLSRRARPRQQSVATQRAMLEILSAQHGGQVRPHRPSTRRAG